jgi:hypothetical protein
LCLGSEGFDEELEHEEPRRKRLNRPNSDVVDWGVDVSLEMEAEFSISSVIAWIANRTQSLYESSVSRFVLQTGGWLSGEIEWDVPLP